MKISDLLDQNKSQKNDLQILRDEMTAIARDLEVKNIAVKEAEQKIAERDQSLLDKQTIIDSLTARLPEQAEVDEKIKFMDKQIEELRASLSVAETARIDAIAAADKSTAKLEIVRQQSKHEEEAHKQEMEMANRQAAADLKAAVADARQEERDRAQAKIDHMQSKIED